MGHTVISSNDIALLFMIAKRRFERCEIPRYQPLLLVMEISSNKLSKSNE